MALELEQTIMQEIGLGQPYNWFNGSGSCLWIAQSAVRKLPEAIQKHVTAGEKIVRPDSRLMNLAQEATEWDEDRYTLTKTWQVCSEVIAAHIHAAHESKERQAGFLYERYMQIEKYYQPDHQRKGRFTHPWDEVYGRIDKKYRP